MDTLDLPAFVAVSIPTINSFDSSRRTLGMPKRLTPFPVLYARAKTGAIRVYRIQVEYMGDHSVLTTTKKIGFDGKETIDRYEYWQGVNIGKANETTFHEQAIFEGQSRFNKLLDNGYTTTVPEDRFNTDAAGNMKPMLAIGFKEDKITFPCIVQPKYDGVRCLVFEKDGQIHIISRKGKPYNIPHIKKWAEEHRDFLPLDGELYNHGELSFQEITSAVKKLSDITPKIHYVVYDAPVEGVSFGERWVKLETAFKRITEESPVYLSDYKLCFSMKDIMDDHRTYVGEGYEGVIIRNCSGRYEFGFRSNNLIKLKDFDTEEFEIVDVVEATGRDAGTAVFVCSCPGGLFNVKPQGTRELRKEYFDQRKSLIGKFVTVQFQGLTDEKKPRFPSAIAIRDYE